MLKATTSKTSNSLLCGTLAAVLSLVSSTALHAELNNVSDALEVAIKHEAVSKRGETIRLYSLSANYLGDKKRWNFYFFDTGENLHAVTVTNSGKALHHLRSKGDLRIFEELNFSQLPHPREVLLDGLIQKGIAAMSALKFKPVNDGQLHLRYQIVNDPRNKDKARHLWSVTLPIGDGKKGKTATFMNGQIDTVTNAIISGSS